MSILPIYRNKYTLPTLHRNIARSLGAQNTILHWKLAGTYYTYDGTTIHKSSVECHDLSRCIINEYSSITHDGEGYDTPFSILLDYYVLKLTNEFLTESSRDLLNDILHVIRNPLNVILHSNVYDETTVKSASSTLANDLFDLIDEYKLEHTSTISKELCEWGDVIVCIKDIPIVYECTAPLNIYTDRKKIRLLTSSTSRYCDSIIIRGEFITSELCTVSHAASLIFTNIKNMPDKTLRIIRLLCTVLNAELIYTVGDLQIIIPHETPILDSKSMQLLRNKRVAIYGEADNLLTNTLINYSIQITRDAPQLSICINCTDDVLSSIETPIINVGIQSTRAKYNVPLEDVCFTVLKHFNKILHDARILIVEDDRANANILKNIMSNLNFHNITIAYSCKEAMSIIDEHYDCCLMDLRLPDGNGVDLANSIHEKYPFIVFIGVTAQLTHASTPWFCEFVYKPINVITLEEKLRTILR